MSDRKRTFIVSDLNQRTFIVSDLKAKRTFIVTGKRSLCENSEL